MYHWYSFSGILFQNFSYSIAFNDFLFKLKRKDSPNCCFCEKYPETIIHVFCECEVVIPLWNDMVKIINHKKDVNFSVCNFDKMFGIQDDKFLTFLFLIIKYYIFVSKLQNKEPNFVNLLTFIKNIRETEYNITNRRNKLPIHFKKMEVWFINLFFMHFVVSTQVYLTWVLHGWYLYTRVLEPNT